MEKQPQLTVPMLLVSVSRMALLDNTSGHLQLVLLKSNQAGMMPVLVMLVLVLESHHLWVETISVSQGLTRDHTVTFIQMTLSGMAVDVLAAVAVAHSTILHTLLSNSPTLPLMILRPDCVDWMLGRTLQLSSLNSMSNSQRLLLEMNLRKS